MPTTLQLTEPEAWWVERVSSREKKREEAAGTFFFKEALDVAAGDTKTSPATVEQPLIKKHNRTIVSFSSLSLDRCRLHPPLDTGTLAVSTTSIAQKVWQVASIPRTRRQRSVHASEERRGPIHPTMPCAAGGMAHRRRLGAPILCSAVLICAHDIPSGCNESELYKSMRSSSV